MIRPKLTQATREKVAYRSGGRCELAFAGCWGSEDLHVHHRKLRRHGDHTPENLIHACGHCHTLVHDEVGTAQQMGWLVSEWDDPASVPWLRRGELWDPT